MEQRTLLATTDNSLLQTPLDQLDRLSPTWRQVLDSSDTQPVLVSLSGFLADRLAAGTVIYPRFIFRALEHLEPESVRVVILGQDPYHGPNQAQGLAFSVPDQCPTPPSLRNIFKELSREYPDAPLRRRNELSDWARQGVLLLNTALTVEHASPASHARRGWEQITDAIIRRVAQAPQPKVFMLWGAHAQSKRGLLAQSEGGPMHILTANHPSPLSATRPPLPFMGCDHFVQANDWLKHHGQTPINWLGATSRTEGS